MIRVSVLLVLLASAGGQASLTAKVLLPFIAVDRHGQPITDLKPESLMVADEKARITSGVKLIPGSSLPLRLGVLFDTSNSQRNNALYEAGVSSVKDFVKQVMRHDQDRVFFEFFSTMIEATPLLSRERLSGVSFPNQVGGGTALYNAIAVACTDRMGSPDWRTPARRVIVLVSDGDDNLSSITRAKAEALLVSSGVVVFTIATNNTGRESKGESVLEKFSDSSGGIFYSRFHQRDMPKVFDQIREQIESMYYLSYTPPVTQRGGVHKVEVQPVKGIKAQFRMPRYYASNP